MAWSTPATWVAGAVLTAAQLNAQLRDNLDAAFPVSVNAWTAWTPTLVNMTGTAVASYMKIGRGVWWKFKLTLGTMGTIPTFSLPFTVVGTAGDIIGEARLRDVGTADYRANVTLATTTTAGLVVNTAGGTYVAAADLNATVPMTWAASDIITAFGVFEATT